MVFNLMLPYPFLLILFWWRIRHTFSECDRFASFHHHLYNKIFLFLNKIPPSFQKRQPKQGYNQALLIQESSNLYTYPILWMASALTTPTTNIIQQSGVPDETKISARSTTCLAYIAQSRQKSMNPVNNMHHLNEHFLCTYNTLQNHSKTHTKSNFI